jgi:hypothetical protein
MVLPLGVISVFTGLAIWVALGIYALMRGRVMPALVIGIALMLYLNIGSVLNGPAASIANFVGI